MQGPKRNQYILINIQKLLTFILLIQTLAMSYTNIITNNEMEFYELVNESDYDQFWVFWANDKPIKSILKDSREFYSIPRNQLKAAAREVAGNPHEDTVVYCTMYSNAIYDCTTGEFDPINEGVGEYNDTSHIKCRVHKIMIKGHQKTNPSSPKKAASKNSRNVIHSDDESSKRHKSTHKITKVLKSSRNISTGKFNGKKCSKKIASSRNKTDTFFR